MQTTRDEFNKRLQEIDLYFSVLQPLDSCDCAFESKDLAGNVSRFKIDTELCKILKANGFILLYNLLEATIRNTLIAISNIIASEKLKYQDFSDNLKKLWINHSFKSVAVPNIDHKSIKLILEDIVNSECVKFNHESVSISGNIDAQQVREIAKQIGYKQPSNGHQLKDIKDKRNQLAHGEKTFCEIGKNYSVNDLIELKNALTFFINEVLDNVQEYIDNKEYRRSTMS